MNSTEEKKKLFKKLENLATEKRNSSTLEIDLASAGEIARLINAEDQKVALQVEKKLDVIADVIELVSDAFQMGGRLLYFGAGTSGRLGVLDAAECPPTFGTPPEQVEGFIAGGEAAMFVAQEGAEDSEEIGAEAVEEAKVAPPDVICGLAASGRTPYVHGAIKEAAKRGCKTILVTTVPAEQIDLDVDYLIDVPVGPEVIMGSTRMKSGTAQKMVLNMITTGAMIRQGKIYENVMVDLMLSNKKLEERAKRILMIFSEVDYETAEALLNEADGHVKTALLMALGNLNAEDAKKLLKQNDGFVRKALLGISEG
ncbi:MAG: N-acetylmuramic acid 6-phosphate etherase [Gracilimonas sp.]|uniref:N-acetylmuramic acid 6-phosphate etherase n=1 Tax=Gracilimonas TaxID=649462 RepID=UPI001B2BAFF4|nr:N-acetylmuramic acid 6-phosphate etherase [Gracilimonas sp.]MBO6586324.1 N-acetylmuramic acid 6-phosphate etherase [Gracilimonas sp.]MBO6614981.1 N-acetylmuramic acid 6-phosphate etherase [Gracilimonas sp.]